MFYNIMCPFIPIDFEIQVARYRFLSLVSDCNVPWSISPPYKTLTCWRFFWLIYYNEVTVNVWRISITFQPWPRRLGRQPELKKLITCGKNSKPGDLEATHWPINQHNSPLFELRYNTKRRQYIGMWYIYTYILYIYIYMHIIYMVLCILSSV